MQQIKKELQQTIAKLKGEWGINNFSLQDLAAILEKVVAAVDKAAQLAEANALPNYAGLVMRGITIYSERVAFPPDSSERAPETAVPAVATCMGNSEKFTVGLYDYGTGIYYSMDHNGKQLFMANNALILHTSKEVYFLKEDRSTPNSYYLYDLSGNKATINQSNADLVLRQA